MGYCLDVTKKSKIMTQGKGFGGFGLGKMKELADAFKKAQQVQEDAKKLQEELEVMEIEGQAGDVTVVLSGNQEPRRVSIGADAASKNPEELSQLVLDAMMDAYEKSTATMRERMELLTSGLNIPGL
jgi:nucleoid-associated protein EbfC